MNARRVSLSELAERQDSEAEEPARPPTVEPSGQRRFEQDSINSLTQEQTTAPFSEQPTPLRTSQQKRVRSVPAPAIPPRMRFDEYERKETRLRDDQYAQLTALSRRLNKARKGRGERITENTLIRVGIDLLLREEAGLQGFTESELRESVGL